MALRVEIQPQAYDDLDSIADYIKARSSFSTAEKWFNGIMDDIASLKEMPERCAIAPESVDLDGEVRVLLHGSRNRTCKIYFSVDQSASSVWVFHIRHYARRPISAEELEDLMDEQEDENVENGVKRILPQALARGTSEGARVQTAYAADRGSGFRA